MISGILPIDKPVGWTSHDVVAKVRRLAGQKQVGHAGTLDPLATGVLLVVLGDATKLSSYLMESSKVYCADVVLGVRTVTDDAEAPLLEQRDVSGIEREQVKACLSSLTGEVDQIPPAYAAVRHGGQKMYALARRGVTVQAPPRQVIVQEIDLVDWRSPRVRLRVHCGAGTYIRSIARDLGTALGVGGYLHALRRTRSGSFGIAQCVTMDALQQTETLVSFLQPLDRAVLDLPAVVLTEEHAARVRLGQAVPLGAAATGTVRLYDPSGILIGLGTPEGLVVGPRRVFAGV